MLPFSWEIVQTYLIKHKSVTASRSSDSIYAELHYIEVKTGFSIFIMWNFFVVLSTQMRFCMCKYSGGKCFSYAPNAKEVEHTGRRKYVH